MANWILSAFLLVCIATVLVQVEAARVKCDQDATYCLKRSGQCVDGHCQCKPSQFHGNPAIHCYKHRRNACIITNDPAGSPFSGGPFFRIDIPCAFKAAEVTVKQKDNQGAVKTTCGVRVKAFSQRIEGKMFLSGYSVRLVMANHETGAQGKVSYKAYGSAFEGDYTYHLKYKLGDGNYQDIDGNQAALADEIMPGENKFEHGEPNNRVVNIIEHCGVSIIFRPADAALGKDQTDLPGLTIGVIKQSDVYDVTYSDEPGFCMSPDTTFQDAGDALNMNAHDAPLYNAMAQSIGHTFPGGAAEQCEALKDTAVACNNDANRQNGMSSCRFIFDLPLFAKCYSSHADSRNLIQLFNNCLASFCSGNTGACNAVKTQISNSGCGDHGETITCP